ncbi:type II CRISPR RNA-guided endonuclease Cas9 [Falsiroseomonas sp. CW058]|uniref:type II CRISPR RNA-guided endonuclease Cas9 n=1 Tax=Falsiroseomonas sp. CW058 TaxID=3388664 RepID=UPI003D320B7D
MPYRLALDLGANSIGWCCLELDERSAPAGILGMAVRIFPDGRNPKDGSSNAAARRLPRAMRRNRDRYLQRRSALLNALTRLGLMPNSETERRRIASLDPWPLRAEALTRRLLPAELGRVIFHLAQRRGFASNRKTDRGNEESGKIATAAGLLKAELARARSPTLGAWLAERHVARQPVRTRLVGAGAKAAYGFYPTRDLVRAEFDTIWRAQAAWNPALTEGMGQALRQIVFHQRPLRAVPRGRCWLEPEEDRAYRALPTAQRFRIAQELANLRISAPGQPTRALSVAERAVLFATLRRGRDLSFDKIRSGLKLPADTDFNLQSAKRDGLKGDETAHRLGAKRVIGDAWHELPVEVQDAAVELLLDADDETSLASGLAALGLNAAQAAAVAKSSLPDGTAALSVKAMRAILPHLEQGCRYDEAVKTAGYAHHSNRRTGEIRNRLPYYGEILGDRIGSGSNAPEDADEKRLGRASNPTVHVGLNELRRVVNAIIERFGPPQEVSIEVLRELGRSKAQREAVNREQAENQRANERRAREIERFGFPVNSRNLMRFRIWEEQARDPKDRVCPYTGAIITPRAALSDEVEEDHILPFALTFDDSAANRVLCTREANRLKRRQSPFDAFGHTAEWPAILERARLLPPNKRWRFQPDALARLSRDGDFLARHLTESAWLARLARMYLEVIAPDRVVAVPGRITAMLRDALGLNSDALLGKGGARKDRTDHRHHAIDALVVGLIDRSFLQRVQTAAKRGEEEGRRRFAEVGEPWPGFIPQAAAATKAIFVSHKPDHGWQAALHNDTAYGPIRNAQDGEPNVVVRRPLEALGDKGPDAAQAVRDPTLAAKVREALLTADKQARKAALAAVEHPLGVTVRRVRMVERLDSAVVLSDRRTGVSYKVLKRDGNHRAEVWRMPGGRLRLWVVSTFDAAREAEARRLGRPVPDLRPHPAARLMMRLHKGDMVAMGVGTVRRILTVVNLDPGRLVFATTSRRGTSASDTAISRTHFAMSCCPPPVCSARA